MTKSLAIVHGTKAPARAARPVETVTLACPHCAAELSTIRGQLVGLQTENARLVAALDYWNAGPFVASRQRKLFHRPYCKWMSYVPDSSLLEFSSHEDSVAAGYKPCKTCCS